MKYYIIAGEASGDLHASNLMRGIYTEDPQATIRFWGGDCMEAVFKEMDKSGTVGKAQDYREGAIMGVFEVIARLGKLLRRMSDCRKDVLSFAPDVLILVDYPGFNLKMAEWAHGKGIKVFYYIAPKVWASREWRIKSIKKNVDRLFIVFPFEKQYFDSKGVPYIYCGNPLVDAVDNSPAMSQSHDDFCRECGFEPGTKVVALLAGSRLAEVRTMMPVMNEVVALTTAKTQFAAYKFVIAGGPGRKEEDYGEYDHSRIKLLFGRTQHILHAADAAVVNSGTASLEAALMGTPQVVAYKFASRATYWLAKYFLFHCKFISLGNLCLDRLAFKEFYTEENCNSATIAAELERLLSDEAYVRTMKADYAEIRESLGGSGASVAVAKRMIEEMKEL